MHSGRALTKIEKGCQLIKPETIIEEARLAMYQHLSGGIKYFFN